MESEKVRKLEREKRSRELRLTRGPPYPLRGCLRARALEWESWISLRWLFGDSNAAVSLRWGLGGLRHFRGALRPFRHSSRGLPTGSAIRCHSSPSCAGAYDSGFVGPRLLDVATGGVWDSFVLLPRILGCWGSLVKSSQVPTLHTNTK